MEPKTFDPGKYTFKDILDQGYSLQDALHFVSPDQVGSGADLIQRYGGIDQAAAATGMNLTKNATPQKYTAEDFRAAGLNQNQTYTALTGNSVDTTRPYTWGADGNPIYETPQTGNDRPGSGPSISSPEGQANIAALNNNAGPLAPNAPSGHSAAYLADPRNQALLNGGNNGAASAGTINQPLPANPFSQTLNVGSSGSDVANLQKILNAQGANLTVDGKYGPLTAAAVKAYQQSNGLKVDGIFGPQTSGSLTGSINAVGNPQNQPASTIPTPAGRVDPNAPVNLTSGSSPTFDSSAIGNLSTADVLNKNLSQSDDINAYLKKQSDAYSALESTKAQALQGQADIMYGKNNSGGADASLQGAEQAQFDRQMAFRTVPAEIAYNNAQMALSLYKQTPAYLTEVQARDTAFNMLQNYADINYAYDPNKTAQENLQAIKENLPSSAKYQASLVNYKGYVDVNGVFHLYNSKNIEGSPTEGGAGAGGGGGSATPSPYTPAPSAKNPVTPTGTYLGVGTDNINSFATLPTAKTSTQVNFNKDWTSGGVADSRGNLNTAIGHLFDANVAFNQIGNGGNTLKNSLRNGYYSNFDANSPIAGALSSFKTAQSKASGELSAAYNQDTGTERALAAAESGSSSSSTQWNSFLQTSTKLLASKLGSQADSFRQTYGYYPSSLDLLVSPPNQVRLSLLPSMNLNGIVPGVHVSPSTQALINSAVLTKDGKIYISDKNGNAIELQ